MKLIHALLPLCALVLPCALHADTFEGKVTMTITASDSKNGPQSINYSMKPGYMRMDMNVGKGFGGMIMDFKNRQMLILMPQQKMYMVKTIDEPQIDEAKAKANRDTSTKFVNTGEKETILGYTCTKLVVSNDRTSSDIWVTDQLGNFAGMSPGGGGFGRRSQPPPEWESALKGVGFFPMRVVSTDKEGKKFKLEVTSVEKQSLSDSLFEAPDGWRKFDMGAMLGGAMSGAFGGGHSSDSN